MGLVAARWLQDLLKGGTGLISFSVFNALVGIEIATLLARETGGQGAGDQGDALRLPYYGQCFLYCRASGHGFNLARSQSSQFQSLRCHGLGPPMSLFHIIIGLPIYFQLIQNFWG